MIKKSKTDKIIERNDMRRKSRNVIIIYLFCLLILPFMTLGKFAGEVYGFMILTGLFGTLGLLACKSYMEEE